MQVFIIGNIATCVDHITAFLHELKREIKRVQDFWDVGRIQFVFAVYSNVINFVM